jgi:hypothetical protein
MYMPQFYGMANVSDEHKGRYGEWITNGSMILHVSLDPAFPKERPAAIQKSPEQIRRLFIKIKFNGKFLPLPAIKNKHNIPTLDDDGEGWNYSSWDSLNLYIDNYYLKVCAEYGLTIYYNPEYTGDLYLDPLPIIKDGKIVGAVMGMEKPRDWGEG